jgi:tryptophan synthase beta chain
MLPSSWYNIVPFIKQDLGFSIPPLLDPKTGNAMSLENLSRILPTELAKQELGVGMYKTDCLIPIPEIIQALYKTYRPTPLVRAEKLERALGLKTSKIYYKREDANVIGSYKLNSSYAQAYYAKEEGVKEFIGDTGPGNWGMGMALACKEFGLPATIYMEEKNYRAKIDKVKVMKKFGAKVIPVTTEEGTIAASLSIAIEHVLRDSKNKLSLGCLTAYSALHNTVMGLELKNQLEAAGIIPDSLIGVVGGGSSFSGLIFPFLEHYRHRTRFIAIESASVPSFSQGEYRYENPDLIGLMPRAKMYTLGNTFVPKNLGASGLNYHGKNPLLSLLVNKKLIDVVAYRHDEVDALQDLFAQTEGIKPAAESCYAIKGAIEEAKRLDGQEKIVVFSLTGNAQSLEL